MNVLLKEDVEYLGLAGEIHKVANGYGRNYLLPRGLAVKATPGALKQATAWRERAATRRAELRAEYEALSAKINGVRLLFEAKAGSKGKLYGSITTADVVDRLNETLGTEIDRRKVESEPLRQIGEHTLSVRLSGEFQPEFVVVIQAEGAPAQEEAADETAVEAEAEVVTDEAEEATTEEMAEEAEAGEELVESV